MKGGITPVHVDRLLAGTLLLVGACFGVAAWRGAAPAVLRRAALFAAILGAISLAVEGLYLSVGYGPEYYFYKYYLHSVVILLLAAASLLAWIGGCVWARSAKGAGWRLGLLAIASVAGIGFLHGAINLYLPSFQQRTSRRGPWPELKVLTR